MTIEARRPLNLDNFDDEQLKDILFEIEAELLDREFRAAEDNVK